MNNRSPRIVIVVALFIFLPIHSIASTIGLAKTGQTTCYNESGNPISCAGTGQDGEIRAGLAWPSPRFTNNGDGTITDNLTGLMWLQDANCIKTNYPGFDNDATPGDGGVTWPHALDFVKGVNDGTYSDSNAGYTDWRLPNVNELFSLRDLSQHSPALTSGNPFLNVVSAEYWASTCWPATRVWTVNVYHGNVLEVTMASYYLYVWPVRSVSNGPARVWKTGQTACYDRFGSAIDCAGTGQDGEIQAGVAWPSPRFTNNGDGTITDNLTGLMWLQNCNCIKTNYPDYDTDGTAWDGAVTWQHALNFIKGVNDGTYPDCCAGYTDWRLPNQIEMFSLAYYGGTDQSLWLAGEGFTNVEHASHWTSNSAMDNPQLAFAGMVGSCISADKGYTRYFFMVRRGKVRSAAPWILLLLLGN